MTLTQRLADRGWLPRNQAEAMVLLPACTLIGFWLGGEPVLIATAVLGPLILLILGRPRPALQPLGNGFGGQADLVAFLDPILAARQSSGQTTACLVIAFDDPRHQLDRHDAALREQILRRTAERIAAVLREGDLVTRLADGSIAAGLAPIRRFDLEAAIQLATRLRAAALVPLVTDDLTLHPSVSVGFCLAEKAVAPQGARLLDAAQIAVDEALHHGPGAIRAFQPEMARRRADRTVLRSGLERALEEGQIRPWFQPQLCAATGKVSGFEALARWHHPERGLLAPADFLPVIEDSGLSESLGEVILYGALSALSRWDEAGFCVPRVSVNLSAAQLASPGLAAKLAWEVDRFNLAPNRITLEVLETVAAGREDDVIVQNLTEAARIGFGVDLDDFGTGQASIANIRRFSIRRIKIDRSFVTKVGSDPDQANLVAAIQTLCDKLGLETIAEGVETPEDYARLVGLGCTHLQGFGIARPMAVEECFGWIERAQRQGKWGPSGKVAAPVLSES